MYSGQKCGRKGNKKGNKYQDLKTELLRIWETSVTVVPVVLRVMEQLVTT